MEQQSKTSRRKQLQFRQDAVLQTFEADVLFHWCCVFPDAPVPLRIYFMCSIMLFLFVSRYVYSNTLPRR